MKTMKKICNECKTRLEKALKNKLIEEDCESRYDGYICTRKINHKGKHHGFNMLSCDNRWS